MVLLEASIFSASFATVRFSFFLSLFWVDHIRMGPKTPPSNTEFVDLRMTVQTFEVTPKTCRKTYTTQSNENRKKATAQFRPSCVSTKLRSTHRVLYGTLGVVAQRKPCPTR